MKDRIDHISVCVCTYRRPNLLKNLLEKIQVQKTADLFTFSVVVIDNDHEETAKATVRAFQDENIIDVKYYCEPLQNISLARNKAVTNASGDFIAFIDDDEFPSEDWLLNLFNIFKKNKVNGILGPVKPYFETTPPEWILKGKICERKSYSTGTILKKDKDTRTGNVLLTKEIFDDKNNLFNPEFGRTGGEDVDFFRRMMRKGLIFMWCDEAVVYEFVPVERLTKNYYFKRALLRGKVSLQHLSSIAKIYYVMKSIIAFILYSLALPFFYISGEHIFMKYMIKYYDHVGRLLTVVGFNLVKEKNF
jgi:succinoglycan biosynthesis protein ExoM